MVERGAMLVAISAVHGRHALTRAWAEHTASVGFSAVVVCITGDEERLTTQGIQADTLACLYAHEFEVVVRPNDPLSGKFNAALEAALRIGATRIMILPSDDFVSAQWVMAARESEEDYMYPHTLATVDSETQATYKITKLSFGTLKYGAGRVVSRKVIEKLGGRLWPENLNRGLDGASHAAITRAGFPVKVVETEGIPITDVKTKENLWPFQTWQTSGRPCTIDEALHMCSPSVRAQIDALKQ